MKPEAAGFMFQEHGLSDLKCTAAVHLQSLFYVV